MNNKIRFFNPETGKELDGDFLVNRDGVVIGCDETRLFLAPNVGWEVVKDTDT